MPGVRFLAPAAVELAEARNWYERVRMELAAAFMRSLEDALGQIERFPASGKPQGSRVRALLIRGFPYTVVYREHDEVIEVIALAHTSRRPGFWRDRIR